MIDEQIIEEEYHVSWYIIAYKFIYGLVEFILGTGIIFYGKTVLTRYNSYAAQELLEDPHDLIVRLTHGVVPNLLAHNVSLAFYLILLGGVKIAGSIGLIYKKNWGVDLLVALTIVMFPFQFIRLLIHPSLPDFIYIFIGILISLYLVNFRPHDWAKRVVKKYKK
ncbi:MAG TPA: DUF2127 domain-containing protein [Patescibacteria group bacterium]